MDAYNKIKSGQSFEGVARAVSEGQYKDKGGEWPVLPAKEFPDFVQQAVSTMKPGDVSAPIESKEAAHPQVARGDPRPGRQSGNLKGSYSRCWSPKGRARRQRILQHDHRRPHKGARVPRPGKPAPPASDLVFRKWQRRQQGCHRTRTCSSDKEVARVAHPGSSSFTLFKVKSTGW